ncbi:hypothetical protein SAMN02910358_02487 [Lachnospiraceae bacterium XBB1006]|nr:hypothetical protein SAMN02910358_02487 [Lachnospiraceae bacterium XBB1006]
MGIRYCQKEELAMLKSTFKRVKKSWHHASFFYIISVAKQIRKVE